MKTFIHLDTGPCLRITEQNLVEKGAPRIWRPHCVATPIELWGDKAGGGPERMTPIVWFQTLLSVMGTAAPLIFSDANHLHSHHILQLLQSHLHSPRPFSSHHMPAGQNRTSGLRDQGACWSDGQFPVKEPCLSIPNLAPFLPDIFQLCPQLHELDVYQPDFVFFPKRV